MARQNPSFQLLLHNTILCGHSNSFSGTQHLVRQIPDVSKPIEEVDLQRPVHWLG